MESDVPLLPFSLLPPKLVFGLASKMRGMGGLVHLWVPMLSEDLVEAGYSGIDAATYSAASGIAALVNFVAVLLVVLVLGAAMHKQIALIALAVALAIGFATLFTCLAFPQITATRMRRSIDANMAAVTRQLLVQIRSGVPLFNALLSVSSGHQKVSEEFYKIVSKLNAGVPETDALAEASATSPSLQFRRVVWQIGNALKVGTDVGAALEATLSELELDQIEHIKEYAQELSPLTMVYMITAIIIPSLGITLIIVIGSLLSITIPEIILPIIFVGMVGFQLFFLNFVSTRRPVV